jgi:membrane protein required for colicin V production
VCSREFVGKKGLMNAADWLIIGALFVSVAIAVSQGFFYEIISLAGTVVGYLLASWQYHRVADWLAPYVKNAWVGEITGFLIIFVAVVILAGLIARVVRWAMKEAGLSWFDRILGAGFGALRGGLIVAVVSLVMTSFTPGSRLLEGSQLAPYFLVVGRAVIWLAPSDLRARFFQGLNILHSSEETKSAPTGH